MIWERSGKILIPVWVMNFGGWYGERAIPVVKEALRQMAKTKTFYGGRGAPAFMLNGLRYTNSVCRKDFHSFKGREEVTDDQTRESLGCHDYSGMALFPVPVLEEDVIG